MSRSYRFAGLAGAAVVAAGGAWSTLSLGERAVARPAPPKPVVITPEATQAADSVTEFTFDLYRRTAEGSDGNVFLSPYSAYGALLMVAEGARGQTAEEIGAVLHFPDSARVASSTDLPWKTTPQLQGFSTLGRSLAPAEGPQVAALREKLAALEAELAKVQKQTAVAIQNGRGGDFQRESKLVEEVNALRSSLDPYELRIANAVWVDADFTLRKPYLAAVTEDYGATAKTANFRTRPEEEREAINAWASDQTNGRITDILAPGTITPLTRLVLTNAVFFKGEWTDPFEEQWTKEEDFTVANGETSKCMLMGDWREARYAEYRPDGTPNGLEKAPPPEGSPFKFQWKWADNPDGWKVLELPYKGGRLAFVALLPGRADGVAALEQRLTADSLKAWLAGVSSQSVQLNLPRFKMKEQYELGPQLSGLGMAAAFAPGGLTGVSDDLEAKQLFISQVIQATFVELNEKGTEAAAVTALPAPAAAAFDPEPEPPPPVFRADHPFVFLIRDVQTGAVLFIGRVAQP